MLEDAATLLRVRLRDDLRSAMRNKAADHVRVLRTLLAEIDNSEAVSVGSLHDRYVVKSFGDRSAEAPRKRLTHDELQELLRRDRNERLKAAADIEAGDQPERAKELRREVSIVERYIVE